MDESDGTYLVDQIFPAGELHLIGGPSGAGKSTWNWQFIEAWQRGEEIFGHASHPQPFVYISLDRSRRSISRTLRRLNVVPQAACLTTDDFNLNTMTLDSFFKTVLDKSKGAKVWFIEGFALLLPDKRQQASEYKTVALFLCAMQKRCEKEGVTIFGIVHSPKTKEADQYTNPRQRILGTVAWAAYSETIILIEPVFANKKSTECARELFVLPRNAPEELHHMAMDEDGMLYETLTTSDQPKLLLWVQRLAPDVTFLTAEIVEHGIKIGIAKRTIMRWLNSMCENGIIARVKKGTYKVVIPV